MQQINLLNIESEAPINTAKLPQVGFILRRREKPCSVDNITWGVDGKGNKHYLCEYCELVFGDVDPDTIIHKCDTTKPRYHNRDKIDDRLSGSVA